MVAMPVPSRDWGWGTELCWQQWCFGVYFEGAAEQGVWGDWEGMWVPGLQGARSSG